MYRIARMVADGSTTGQRTRISLSNDVNGPWRGSEVRPRCSKFASAQASVHNHFNRERHLTRRKVYKEKRSAAPVEWHSLAA